MPTVSINHVPRYRWKTRGIKAEFDYDRREDKGIQPPLTTLKSRSGTCRDYAVLMMEAVRALGFAAYFVSGYLNQPSEADARIGGHSTDAHLRVFLPGSGWIEFAPTNRDSREPGLVRVAGTPIPHRRRLRREHGGASGAASSAWRSNLRSSVLSLQPIVLITRAR